MENLHRSGTQSLAHLPENARQLTLEDTKRGYSFRCIVGTACMGYFCSRFAVNLCGHGLVSARADVWTLTTAQIRIWQVSRPNSCRPFSLLQLIDLSNKRHARQNYKKCKWRVSNSGTASLRPERSAFTDFPPQSYLQVFQSPGKLKPRLLGLPRAR